ncbi:hypothetical protein [Mycetocola saprophilus]|uniref:hypothetical protein n=1 Tax=Mycetocola saprophilus TaxID=76636 RepID=UPI0012DD24BB|nr:hypothetical protein [Mycetocola saprophilus]
MGLERDGLEGWYSPASTRVDDQPDLPHLHGTYWPEAVYLSNRVLTIRGFHAAGIGSGSSLSAARLRDRVAALVGEVVMVTVDDPAGPRHVTGYVADAPGIDRLSERRSKFSLVISCPDPLKYGPRVDYSVSGASVLVLNSGTGPVAPVLTVSSRVTVVDVQLGGSRVRWSGAADSLLLDLGDGRPLGPDGQETGVLIYADALRVPPGEHRLTVTCDGSLTVSVRSGWK